MPGNRTVLELSVAARSLSAPDHRAGGNPGIAEKQRVQAAAEHARRRSGGERKSGLGRFLCAQGNVVSSRPDMEGLRTPGVHGAMTDVSFPLAPGNLVRHPQRPDWGTGQVQSNIDGRVTVNFPDEGKVVFDSSRVELIQVFHSE